MNEHPIERLDPQLPWQIAEAQILIESLAA
jgi:hypothetical protein